VAYLAAVRFAGSGGVGQSGLAVTAHP